MHIYYIYLYYVWHPLPSEVFRLKSSLSLSISPNKQTKEGCYDAGSTFKDETCFRLTGWNTTSDLKA